MKVCKHTGGPLPANLYNDPKGRPNVYQYRKPDGSKPLIRKPYAEAVALAEKANAARQQIPGNRYSLPFWAGEYVEFMEHQNRGLSDKASWRERRGLIRGFANEFARTRSDAISVAYLSGWWNALTYDQQHNRRDALSKFCIYMMGNGVAKCNPFNTNDDAPHLIERAKPPKARLPLHINEFWKVYKHAEQFVKDAMILSLVTGLRRADLVSLQFDHIVGGSLQVTISKSAKQRGAMRASHLAWPLEVHDLLRDTVNAARQRSLSLKRCPYILAHRPSKNRARPNGGDDHPYKVRSDALSKGFARAARASKLWENLPPGVRAPSFHEVRGLAIERYLAAGTDIRDVAKIAAHTKESITSGYAANHAPEYEAVTLASPVQRPALGGAA